MKRVAVILVALSLASCAGSAGAPEPPSSSASGRPGTPGVPFPPTLAFETGSGPTTVVHWVRGKKHTEIPGRFQAITPDGSIIVIAPGQAGKPGGPTFHDASSGRATNIADRFQPGDRLGFGDGTIVTIRTDTQGTVLHGFDRHFAPKRTISLPGQAATDGSGTRYSEPVVVAGSVFAIQSIQGASTSDELVRLDPSGAVSTSATGEHLRLLAAGADATSLVAVRATSAAERSADRDVVVLDARTGKITKSLGLPKGCGDEPCIERVEASGDRVIVRTFEHTTWLQVAKGWGEDRSQRYRQVSWQSSRGRLESAVPTGEASDLGQAPVRWMGQRTSRAVPGATRLSPWWAPGSLTRP